MGHGSDGDGGGSGDTGVMDSGEGADTLITPDAAADTAAPEDAGSPPVDAASPPKDAASPPKEAGSGCLSNIPVACPDCETMNAGDKPVCETYIACYIANGCNPADSCGQMDGVCGVNTLGGGSAPQSAAVATYNCACP